MSTTSEEISAFLVTAGWGDAVRRPLAGDASARRYERLSRGAERAVLMIAPREDDLGRFTRMAIWLNSKGFSAPRIYAEAPQLGLLLLEDLGDDLVSRLITADPAREAPLYAAITDFLVSLRGVAPPDFLTRLEAPELADLARLTPDWYPTLSRAAAQALPEMIAERFDALDDGARVACLRDFHAENALWLPARSGVARLGLLDFQDAVIAHPAYDLVSALQDARRDVGAAIEAAERTRFAAQIGMEQSRFEALYALLGLQRSVRILGIFARLCLAMGKPGYAALMPRSWGYIERNLRHPALSSLEGTLRAAFPPPTPELIERITAACGQHPMH